MRRAFAFLVSVAAVSTVPAAIATPAPPNTLVAVGGGASEGADSWSTSSNPAVRSIYRRLAPSLGGDQRVEQVRALRLATRSFRVADLEKQARAAVLSAPARWATVELGVGDLCGGTPLTRFRAQLAKGLRALSEHRGDTNTFAGGILAVSIEDLGREWRVLRADPAAARTLRAGARLPCGLGYDVSRGRLAQIRARTIALNEIVKRICFQTERCLYDRGAHFRMPLRAGYFSPRDLRLLTTAGQRALAAIEWRPQMILLRHLG